MVNNKLLLLLLLLRLLLLLQLLQLLLLLLLPLLLGLRLGDPRSLRGEGSEFNWWCPFLRGKVSQGFNFPGTEARTNGALDISSCQL